MAEAADATESEQRNESGVGHDLDLQVEARPIDALTSRRCNPRTHSAKQIRQIADSIKTFGFTNPLLIDSTGTVIAGMADYAPRSSSE